MPRTPSGGGRPLGPPGCGSLAHHRAVEALGCGCLAHHRQLADPRVLETRTPSGGVGPSVAHASQTTGHISVYWEQTWNGVALDLAPVTGAPPPPPVRFPAVLRRDSDESPARLSEGNTTLPHTVPPSPPTP
ncbi:hypothetical protein V6N12_010452 [Hibiscus sabdariffa]|uniref:Uncharacterized protein n=1 Tax=Hibiscus sabdariffa TaxID=183260 RepID=A0ABR2ELT2_9ROSI